MVGHAFKRTGSVEMGDIFRTASAISMFLEEAETRPFINRLLSMPVMNADGIGARQPVLDAQALNPTIEVWLCPIMKAAARLLRMHAAQAKVILLLRSAALASSRDWLQGGMSISLAGRRRQSAYPNC